MRGTRDLAALENSLHKLRDGSAMVRLAASALRSVEYGGEIYNFPPDAFGLAANSDFKPGRFLTADDLVVCTTRLALTDDPDDRRPLIATGLEFEREIHVGYSALFARCDRGFVIVSSQVARVMAEHGFNLAYRAIHFERTHGARYTGLKNTSDVAHFGNLPKVPCGRNIGYIAYLPQISPSVAAGVLSVFSLDGTSTAAWARLVAEEYLDSPIEIASGPRPRLVISEFTMTFPEHVPCLPSDVKLELARQKTIDVEVRCAAENSHLDISRGT